MILLSFSTSEDKANHTADEHFQYMNYVLLYFDKTWDNIVAIVGENCSVNASLAQKVARPLVVCASYRFNVAVKDKISAKQY